MTCFCVSGLTYSTDFDLNAAAGDIRIGRHVSKILPADGDLERIALSAAGRIDISRRAARSAAPARPRNR